MFAVDESVVFVRNPDYEITEKEGSKYLLNRQTNGLVEIDEAGESIFSGLPGSFRELLQAYRGQQKDCFRGLFFLLWKSGLIEPEPETHLQPHDIDTTGTETKRYDLSTSAVIITFNSGNYIENNLDSILGQTVVPDEILVVDNASRDDTLEIVREKYKDVRVIANKVNLHYARAVNVGMQHASGRLVIVLNDDTVMARDFVEKILERYQDEVSQCKAAGIVPQIRLNKVRGFINGIGNIIRNRNWAADNYFGVVDLGQFSKLKYTGAACFGAVAIPRAAWAKVGPLDDSYVSFYEDIDWSIRSHYAGLTFLVAPEAVIYHDFGASYPSQSKMTLVVKNRLRWAIKNLGGSTMLGFVRNYAMEDLRNGWRFLTTRNLPMVKAYLGAYWRVFTELPGLLVSKLGRGGVDENDMHAFFAKSPPLVLLQNRLCHPVLTMDTIRDYYMGIEA